MIAPVGHPIAGETRTGAWETVNVELNDLLAELADAGLPTEETEATCRQWAETDPRTLSVPS